MVIGSLFTNRYIQTKGSFKTFSWAASSKHWFLQRSRPGIHTVNPWNATKFILFLFYVLKLFQIVKKYYKLSSLFVLIIHDLIDFTYVGISLSQIMAIVEQWKPRSSLVLFSLDGINYFYFFNLRRQIAVLRSTKHHNKTCFGIGYKSSLLMPWSTCGCPDLYSVK